MSSVRIAGSLSLPLALPLLVLALGGNALLFAQTSDPPAEFKPSTNLVPVESRIASTPEAILLEQAMLDPSSEWPESEAVTLEGLLDGSDEASRRELIHAYWELSLAMAADSFSQKELAWIDRLVDESTEKDAQLTACLAAAAARQQEARLQGFDAQHRLSQLQKQSPRDRLPWPVDFPVTSPYQTYFDALFLQREVALEAQLAARRIHETLPLVHDVIRARAASVVATEQLLKASKASGRVGQQDLILTWERLSAERRAFLASVLQYNLSICDYAVRVAAGNQDHARLLSMLLRSPQGKSEQGKAEVVPASGTEIVGEQTAQSIQPPRTEPRELPLEATRQIRSILVPSRSELSQPR